MRTLLSVFVLGVLAACTTAPAVEPADLVVFAAEIHTVDEGQLRAEAFAVRDGRFAAVGTRAEVERYVGAATEVVDVSDAAILPGLIDGHVHLESGLSLVRGVDLTGVAERSVWLERIERRAQELEPGDWIVGGRWDHTLAGDPWPTRAELDAVAPENPVALSDIDGHTTWASSLAIELAGVTRDTPDPDGGRIVRDESGEATGIFLETAGYLVRRMIPPLDADEEASTMRETLEVANRLGLTGVHNMTGTHRIPTYLDLALEGDLPLRVWFGVTGAMGGASGLAALRDSVDAATAVLHAEQGPRLEVGYAKLVADGVLSTRTAALLAPYADAPDEIGLVRGADGSLAETVRELNAEGIPVAIHAIGDQAVRASLDAFETSAGGDHLPNRIEHIEVIDPADAPRFAELGVLASFNPHHCITGIDVYNTDRLGEARAAWSFAWGGLRDAGAELVFGSDWATAPLDPLRQLYAATVREKPAGGPDGGWHPQHKVTWDEALAAYTIAPAAAAGWDDEIGSIATGKRADFVILSGTVPHPVDRSILDLSVVSTWINGEAVYEGAP